MCAIRKIPIIPVTSVNEAVLYTYETSPHIEYILRAAMIQLPTWSHTVVCGVKNIIFIRAICAKIDTMRKIKIINTGHDTPPAGFLLKPTFWKLFTGHRILLYDSFSLLGPNISDHNYDFIGKGITIRSRQTMLECLQYPIRDIDEDVFYKETIIQHNLGHVSNDSIGFWKPWTLGIQPMTDCVLEPLGRCYTLHANIKIYVLCHTQDILEEAFKVYAPYNWAYPILMKYQNYTFENAFWPHLLEIRDEWISCDFVGTISFTANKKLDLDDINLKITEEFYTGMSHVYFSDTGIRVLSNNIKHPKFKEIWSDLLKTLNIQDLIEAWCNFFMCKPALMEGFIAWHRDVLTPTVLTHPLIYSDAKYDGTMSDAELIRLWGHPYYPMVPFIMERLNRAFFIGK